MNKKNIKNKLLKSATTPIFKRILIIGAAAAAATAAVGIIRSARKKQKLLASSDAKNLKYAKNIYISGGSIASYAAAAYLIKDGGYNGSSIHIYGSPSSSVLSEEYGSVGPYFRELMDNINAYTADELNVASILDNSVFTSAPDVKFINMDGTVHTLDLTLSREMQKKLIKAMKTYYSAPAELNGISISQYFKDMPDFFESDLFVFTETTFGLRPEHKLTELLLRLEQLASYAPEPGLYDTLYHDFSTVSCLEEYLEENGVEILHAAEITGVEGGENKLSALHIMNDGTRMTIYLNKEDFVILTTGNISDNYSEGGFSEIAPIIETAPFSSALWADASAKDDSFGLPETMLEDVPEYMEFSIVDNGSYLLKKICNVAGCTPDIGLSLIFGESNWKMKLTSEAYSFNGDASEDDIVLTVDGAVNAASDIDDTDLTQEDIDAALNIAEETAINYEHQPVIMVKGVYTGSEGNFIDKTMRECTGVELLYELCCHLGLNSYWDEILENIKVVMVSCYPLKNAPLCNKEAYAAPELMPYDNCVSIGQYVATDVPSCTIEQEIRSAQMAVYKLIEKKDKKVKNKADIKKLWKNSPKKSM